MPLGYALLVQQCVSKRFFHHLNRAANKSDVLVCLWRMINLI